MRAMWTELARKWGIKKQEGPHRGGMMHDCNSIRQGLCVLACANHRLVGLEVPKASAYCADIIRAPGRFASILMLKLQPPSLCATFTPWFGMSLSTPSNVLEPPPDGHTMRHDG